MSEKRIDKSNVIRVVSAFCEKEVWLRDGSGMWEHKAILDECILGDEGGWVLRLSLVQRRQRFSPKPFITVAQEWALSLPAGSSFLLHPSGRYIYVDALGANHIYIGALP